MTISIAGVPVLTNTTFDAGTVLYSPFGNLFTPNPGDGVSDTASNNVTVTVTQKSFLHSNPGTADDQVTLLQAPALIESNYAYTGPATNPAVVNGDAFTTTGPIKQTVGTYNTGTSSYPPIAYSVNTQLAALQVSQPKLVLTGNQIVETDLTVTATDQVGGSTSQVVKYLFTNPVKITNSALANPFIPYSTFYHDTSSPLAVVNVQNDNNHIFYVSTATPSRNVSGTTTISITQSTILHTDPTRDGGDIKAQMPLGTFTFNPTGGDATNVPVIDKNTGVVTLTGSLYAPSTGTRDPVDYPSGYAPHEYSPLTEMASLQFTPGSTQPLSGKEYLESTFVVTATDSITGSNATTTVTERYTNPVSVISSLTGPYQTTYGQTIAPLGGSYISSRTGTLVLTISQTSFNHTDPGKADDQKIAVGPGVFSGSQANVLVSATPSGLTTVSGSSSDVSTLISRLNFTPASVTLTGNQTLETDFTVYASDNYGDFDTLNRVLIESAPPAPVTTTTPIINTPITTQNPTTTISTNNPLNTNSTKPVTTTVPTPTPTTPVATAPITPASVFRFFDTNTGTHFFTSSTDERNTLLASRPDLVQETNGFGAVSAGSPNAVAVFRFFDKVHGTQFITSDAGERDTVRATRSDLSYEDGNVFYEHTTQQTGDVAIYRFFDTKLGTHFYTGNQSESTAISTPGAAGFRADLVSEGVAFYAPSGTFK